MLQELLCRRRDVLMILPYVAIVQEKISGLSSFGIELGFFVVEYAGSKGKFPPIKRREKKSLYIATTEKGHSLVNSLIETGRISSLGLVVVDELHMIGEGTRGAILEMTLAKILYTSKTTQIIGMSATLNNVEDLQKFLQADYYTSQLRPVELKEYLKINDTIYEVDSRAENGMTFSRLLNYKVTLIIPDGEVLRLCAQLPWHTTKESHGYHGKVQVFKRKKADAGHLLDTIQMTGSRQFPMSILDHTTFLPRIVYLCDRICQGLISL